MRKQYKRHIYFNPTERRGLILIITAIVVVYLSGKAYPMLNSKTASNQMLIDTMTQNWILADSVARALRKAEWKSSKTYTTTYNQDRSSRREPKHNTKDTHKVPSVVFPFDPNKLSADSLVILGFDKYVAKNIEKYRKKGGQFRSIDDLKKMYNIDTKLVDKLASSILLPHKPSKIKNDTIPKSKINYRPKQITVREEVFIDINTADQYQWMQLRGIAETKARIIVEKREKLGGFHSKSQIAEIWGIGDSLYLEIAPQLVESDIYRPLLINQATTEELAGHPFISYKKAGIIVAYRNNNGDYRSAADLSKIIAFKPDFINSIDPYIDYSTSEELKNSDVDSVNQTNSTITKD